MLRQDNLIKYHQLRHEYPYFIFKGVEWQDVSGKIQIRYDFDLAGLYHFRPAIRLIKRDFFTADMLNDPGIDTILFNLGMIELISYWKAACPPKVIIKPFHLDSIQIDWWKKLYFNGLGEFFYLNGLQPGLDDFMEIQSETDQETTKLNRAFMNEYIVPIGGGKDSAVTLELLSGEEKHPLVINPRRSMIESIERAGMTMDQTIIIEREIDPLLLDLNNRGFLNGHTPFSAMIAFVGVLTSAITGSGNIALSNESSANEATLTDQGINHQYSKSWEFENDFRWYTGRYISDDIRYFSLLRPLNELQIASLFSKAPKYFHTIRSCNVGSSSNTWCGHCPKCLFTFIILSPFIEQDILTGMFGKNMLCDRELTGILDQLTGFTSEKPFDCVGTIDETNAALRLLIKKHHDKKLPYLLEHYRLTGLSHAGSPENDAGLLHQFNTKHFLNHKEVNRLRSFIHD
jgi:hypothetical protein